MQTHKRDCWLITKLSDADSEFSEVGRLNSSSRCISPFSLKCVIAVFSHKTHITTIKGIIHLPPANVKPGKCAGTTDPVDFGLSVSPLPAFFVSS